jgi:hypothetical protein
MFNNLVEPLPPPIFPEAFAACPLPSAPIAFEDDLVLPVVQAKPINGYGISFQSSEFPVAIPLERESTDTTTCPVKDDSSDSEDSTGVLIAAPVSSKFAAK